MVEPIWGILIAAYLFLGGMAGGAYMIAAWLDFFGKDRYRVLTKSGVYTSLIAILAGLVFLILDLKRFMVAPFSIINAYLHFPESMISFGTWTITAFTIISLLTTILWILRGNRILIKLLEIIGLILGFSTAAYTGTLLSFARGRPFWGSPFLPWLFIISGISTGLCLVVLCIPILGRFMPRLDLEFSELLEQRHRFSETLREIGKYTIALIIFEGLSILLFLGTVWSTHGASSLVFGNLSMLFYAFLLLSLLAPFSLEFYSSRMSGDENTIIFSSLTGSALTLIGGFILRYMILIAGQL
jgi:formate-dependent nitrite reductase membrane component NrfD